MGDYQEYVNLRKQFIKEEDHGLGAVAKMYEQVEQDRAQHSPNLAKDEERRILTGYASDSILVRNDPDDLEAWYSANNAFLRQIRSDGVNVNALSDVSDAAFVDKFADSFRADPDEAIRAKEAVKEDLAGDNSAVPKELLAQHNKILALEDLVLASMQLGDNDADTARAQLLFNEGRAALTKAEQLGAHAANAERFVHRVHAQLEFAVNRFK